MSFYTNLNTSHFVISRWGHVSIYIYPLRSGSVDDLNSRMDTVRFRENSSRGLRTGERTGNSAEGRYDLRSSDRWDEDEDDENTHYYQGGMR